MTDILTSGTNKNSSKIFSFFVFMLLILFGYEAHATATYPPCPDCYRCTLSSPLGGCVPSNCVYDAGYCIVKVCTGSCPGGIMDPITCECVYPVFECPSLCLPGFTQNPFPDCACVCNRTCPIIHTLNPDTCECESVCGGIACIEGVLNTETCECEPIICPSGHYLASSFPLIFCAICPEQQPPECSDALIGTNETGGIETCFIPSESNCSDNTGGYTFMQNCNYTP